MADAVVYALPTTPGALGGFIGFPAHIATLESQFTVTRFDLTLLDVLDVTSDITVRVSDGTTNLDLVISAGNRSASAAVGAVFPVGAVLTYEILAGSDPAGIGLSGLLYGTLGAGASPGGGPGLVTTDQYLAARGIVSVPQAERDFLDQQILVVSAVIREECQRHLNAATYTDSWHRPAVIFTRDVPVIQIRSAKANGGDIDPADLTVDPLTGQVIRDKAAEPGSWVGYEDVELTYDAGYTVLPADLEELVFQTLDRQRAAYASTGLPAADEGSVKRVSVPDAGTIEYHARAGQGDQPGSSDHYLLGWPLKLLGRYVDRSRTTGHPQLARIYTWVQL